MASNPEFLREGSAINDFMRPDRVVIGCKSEKAKNILKELYRPLYLLETPIIFTTRNSRIDKICSKRISSNKITFINEISDLCEKVGANVSDVATINLMEGLENFFTGPGYGGSCFPKDT